MKMTTIPIEYYKAESLPAEHPPHRPNRCRSPDLRAGSAGTCSVHGGPTTRIQQPRPLSCIRWLLFCPRGSDGTDTAPTASELYPLAPVQSTGVRRHGYSTHGL